MATGLWRRAHSVSWPSLSVSFKHDEIGMVRVWPLVVVGGGWWMLVVVKGCLCLLLIVGGWLLVARLPRTPGRRIASSYC